MRGGEGEGRPHEYGTVMGAEMRPELVPEEHIKR
jgi:hypothetical protein